jgi:prepilin-type N-terminal cleavage/methylation domain-containing protein
MTNHIDEAHQTKHAKPRGFTIIEVMIASVIFILSVAGATSAMRTASMQFQNQRHLTVGLQVAETVIEGLLLHFQSSDALDPGVHTSEFDGNGEASAVAVPGGYRATWTVKPADPIDALRRIDVVVTWTLDGAPHGVSLFTYRP